MKDGNYFHVEDGAVGNQDGFERGSYTWDTETGAFSVQIAQDTNGDIGLSDPAGSTTVTVAGETLTYTDNEGSFQLTRVKDASNPIVGACQFGESASFDSRVLVFLPSGYYFEAQVTLPEVSPDGIEKGSYTWNEGTGEFTANVIVDTNGSVGLSVSGNFLEILISGNSLTFTDANDVSVLTRVPRNGATPQGGWQWGDPYGEEYGGVMVFLDNGYYFFMEYSQPVGLSLTGGIERGSYTWETGLDLIPEFSATAIVDTNGEAGFSHVEGLWTGDVFNDLFSVADNRGVYAGYDASKGDVQNRMRFFDSAFEAAIRNTIGKQSGPIMRLDMQRILTMDASGLGLAEVEGIQEAYNMHRLDLSNNQLVDLWQIGDLRELRSLDLSNNEITSLSDLAFLTKLVSLDVSGNNLSDTGSLGTGSDLILPSSVPLPSASTGVLAPLDGIDTLDTLRFANNNIIDLTVLATLPALKKVDLSGNDVTDLTPLSQLLQLERIVVFDNPVDLTVGSAQLDLLNTIVASTGASVGFEAPDPSATYLTWSWGEATQRYRLVWTQFGVL